MKIIRDEREYIIKGLDSDVSLTREQIVELANALEIFKQNNVNLFNENYEILDMDDVNSLRLGFYHNGAEDFRKDFAFLNIIMEKLYRIGETFLDYDFVYDCEDFRNYDGSCEYPGTVNGYDSSERYVSSNHIEKINRGMIMSEKVTNMYLRSHLSSEIIDELLDIANVDIRVNGTKIDVYSFFSEDTVVEYDVKLSSDS